MLPDPRRERLESAGTDAVPLVLHADAHGADDGGVRGRPLRRLGAGLENEKADHGASGDDCQAHHFAIALRLALRDRCLRLGAELPWAERGAILTLLGSAERAFYLINRIVEERQSVSREIAQRSEQPKDRPLGGLQPAAQPAE